MSTKVKVLGEKRYYFNDNLLLDMSLSGGVGRESEVSIIEEGFKIPYKGKIFDTKIKTKGGRYGFYVQKKDLRCEEGAEIELIMPSTCECVCCYLPPGSCDCSDIGCKDCVFNYRTKGYFK